MNLSNNRRLGWHQGPGGGVEKYGFRERRIKLAAHRLLLVGK